MDLTRRTQNLLVDSREWLADEFGTTSCRGITLDGATWGAIFTTGLVPSGVFLAKNTSTNRYGVYVHSGANGLGVCAGVLGRAVQLNRPELGDASGTYGNVTGVLQWQAAILVARLPANSQYDGTNLPADFAAGVQIKFF